MVSQPWTEPESSRLHELLALTPALSWERIAVELNCSKTRIRTRLAELGIDKPDAPHSKPKSHKSWSESDLWWLAELCAVRPRLSWTLIAEQFHCGEKTVQNRCTIEGYTRDPCKSRHIERDAQILAMARNGFRSTEIAKKLHLSRSTVSGVCDRSGVRLVNRQAFNIKRKLKAAEIKRNPPPPATGEAFKPGIWRPLNGRAPVPLIELNPCQCRWPLWETHAEPHTFCGRAVDPEAWRRTQYCQEHYEASTTDRTEQRVNLGPWPTTWSR